MPSFLNPSDIKGMSLSHAASHIADGMEGFSLQNDQLCYMGKAVFLSDDNQLSLMAPTDAPVASCSGQALVDRMVAINPSVTCHIASTSDRAITLLAQQLLAEKGAEVLNDIDDWPLKKAILWELAVTDPDTASGHLYEYEHESDAEKYAFASRLQRRLQDALRLELIEFSDPNYAFQLVKEKLENGTSHAEYFNPSEFLAEYGMTPLLGEHDIGGDRSAFCGHLAHWVSTKAPDHEGVLLPLIEQLKSQSGILEERDIHQASRILYLTTILSSADTTIPIEDIKPFINAVYSTRNRKNLDYLLPGLIELCRCPSEIQAVVCQPVKGGQQVMLANLALLSFLPETLTPEQFKNLYRTLHTGGAGKRALKDAKVFTNWMDTLQRLKANPTLTATSKHAMLLSLVNDAKHLNQNMFALKVLMAAKPDYINLKTDKNDGIDLQGELNTIINEEFGDPSAPNQTTPAIEWIQSSRVPALIPLYLASLRHSGDEHAETMAAMFKEVVHAQAKGQYANYRHDATGNLHLEKLQAKKPALSKGLVQDFAGFSDELKARVKPGDTLEFSENLEDLFLSGYDLYTCQSPDGHARHNKALLSYLVNGQNAFVVLKNNKGQIKARMVVRSVFRKAVFGTAHHDKPALFCEAPYPVESSQELQQLMDDAAREISKATGMPLIKERTSNIRLGEARGEIFPGKAPYEYLDFRFGLGPTQPVTFFAETIKV